MRDCAGFYYLAVGWLAYRAVLNLTEALMQLN